MPRLTRRVQSTFSMFSLGLAAVASSSVAWAKPKPPVATVTTPNPTRLAEVEPVLNQQFTLPNGSRIDLSAHLDDMFYNAVNNTPNIRSDRDDPSGSHAASHDPCNYYYRVRAAVTTLELKVSSTQITFGYSPAGPLGSGVTNIHGSVKLELGAIAMSFVLERCKDGRCNGVISTLVNQTLSGVTGSFGVDFGQITVASQLVYNTPVGKALQNMMLAGMNQLAAHKNITDVNWSARVLKVYSDGTFLFDRGSAFDHIGKDQSFTVSTPIDAEGACSAMEPITDAVTTRVDSDTSVARIDGGISPRAGDIVKIRVAPAATK